MLEPTPPINGIFIQNGLIGMGGWKRRFNQFLQQKEKEISYHIFEKYK
jgi:hypothetical protein